MCYSVESSLSAWIVANSISFYLFTRNRRYDRWNAGFVTVFTTIQLLEAGVWKSLKTGSAKNNELFTKLILMILVLQPTAQTVLGAKFTGKEILWYMSMLYIAIVIYTLFRITSTSEKFYSTKGPRGHLVWHTSNDKGQVTNSPGKFLGGKYALGIGIAYILGLFIPLFFMKDHRGIPLILTGLGTAYVSTYFSSTGEFSSMWCYFAVLYAIVALFV